MYVGGPSSQGPSKKGAACDLESGYNDHMKASTAVGTRELKTRLGTYLRRVREGERILVTDRGEPVAELRGLPDDDGLGGRLALLEAKGLVSRPSRRSLKPLRAIRSRGASLAQAIVEDRENRF